MNLFEPLGRPKRIPHGDSSKEDQFDFFMNKNPRKYEWYTDPQGTVTAGWGLCMSARDMAVIGTLVLNDGVFMACLTAEGSSPKNTLRK